MFVCAHTLASQDVAGQPDPNSGRDVSAVDLVQQALQAEAEHNAPRRDQLLGEALRKDPECAPARWHSGFVRVDDRWRTLAEAQSTFAADLSLNKYRQVRESLAESPMRELLLARWCDEKKLADEARFHWLNVLHIEPLNQEALKALGVQWYNDRLLTRDQVAEQKQNDFKASRETVNPRSARVRQWESRIANWELAAGRGDSNLLATMEADLVAEKSRNAILIVNNLLGRRGEKPRDPEAYQVVSLNWVSFLAKDPANTKYVVMQAIGHPMEPVRVAAAEELKKRPREDYVPLLLACARFPVEFACSVLASVGLANVQYTLDIEGLEADTQIDHAVSLNMSADFYGLAVYGAFNSPWITGGQIGNAFGPKSPRPQDPKRTIFPMLLTTAAVRGARDMESLVDQYNAASAQINQRVTEALERVTGEDIEANPRAWQAWWREYLCDYYELESPQEHEDQERYAVDDGDYGLPQKRPVYRYDSSMSRCTFSPPPDPSCFRGATPVWTNTGSHAIQEIRPGDRVLSQNISSGELAYKLVEQVTKRNPTPMVKITVGGEEIVSTLGHPFWVNGKRWVMAKHLQTGCVLHTVSGPRTIDKVERIPAAKEWYEFSHNLQVADFHTFFVGQNQVLVHHLSMLSILDEGSSRVPGL
jgi:hypothetical protein